MVYASSIYLFIVHDTFSYRQEVLYQKQKRLSTTFFYFFIFFKIDVKVSITFLLFSLSFIANLK